MKSIQKLEKYLSTLGDSIQSIEKVMRGDFDSEYAELRDHYKQFRNFIPAFWAHAGTAAKFIPGWHIDAMADHLQALQMGHITYLLIATVPRAGKSTIGLALFPAWEWSMNPETRFLTCSYSSMLAERDNQNFQQIINSDKYQKIFGKKFFLKITNRYKTTNSKNGSRYATSIDGTATGEGGNMVLIDDANNIRYVNSLTVRQKVCTWWDVVIPSRQNDFNKAKYLVQQQRSHPEDLFGHIKEKNLPGTVVLEFPMEMELSRRKPTIILPGTDMPWIDPRTEEGELLAPLQFSPQKVKEFKMNAGSYVYAGQYQQRPAPEKGAVFEKEWFKLWKARELPDFNMIIQGWDTALSTEANAAYSASTTWGLFDHPKTGLPQLMLLQTWFDRYEWTELRQMVMQQARNFTDVELGRQSHYHNRPDKILIEAKANGISLIQSLKRAGVECEGYNPPKTNKRGHQDFRSSAGKIQRARLIAPIVENGKIWLQGQPPEYNKPYRFGEHFLEAISNFPNNVKATMDLIDTFTMIVEYLQRKGKLYPSDSQPPEIIYEEPKVLKSF